MDVMFAKLFFKPGLWIASGLAVCASVAMGGDNIDVSQAKDKAPWVAAVYALVVLAGILVAAFKNSKRTFME